ncbi:BCCT family transporter [Microbacterium maritypicum]|jgi:choline/carnitine/betaine transport|uniref:BCCT family transporter n=1 Tax=Microbacterium maritypicum TaxID=33918 RepID=A0AAD3X071_MICMQ|nr:MULTISPECIES: BCCT family transporter [Microbacterium]KAB1883145.1 BCCT family transporter [Microbacterium liquefaciens]QYG12186.1 BCCT family transporter [Microbacterium sp. PAMC22086]WKT90716.1 BCCT family transporter [Microbacterium liquefaciens]
METPDEKPDDRSAGHTPPRPRTDAVGTGANRLPTKATATARKIVRDIAAVPPRSVHPALVPGVSVEETGRTYRTDPLVFGVAVTLVVSFIAWGIFAGDNLSGTTSAVLGWVVEYFGFFFTTIATIVLVFMLFVGFSRYGRIPLGRDDEEPEFSMFSWISMLFAAGMGIGLVFWGAAEPLTFFESPPPGTVEANTLEAMHTAQAQVLYHWGPQAWAFYALVGGAIAYGAFRRGRTPLISSIFAPLLGEGRTAGPLGRTIDVFAIIVTLFGTAASLGLGALQIGHGVELVSGIGELGNGVLIAVIALLTACFIASAVSGVSKGIRALSNINAVMALVLAFFVFFVGPTMLILNIIPSIAVQFVGDLPQMIARSASQGEEAQAFLSSWTIFYWAWWISWSPFVGMFIAKISRGRTLRQFVSVVILVPSAISLVWFAIFGSTAIQQQMDGAGLTVDPPEEVLFGVLENLPFPLITSVLLILLISIFFITGADSSSLVMGTLSQQGRPEPTRWVTIVWGSLVGVIAAVLLVTGEEGSGLKSLQNVTIIAALPFAIIMAFMMVAFMKDLRRDPLILRERYAKAAVRHSVMAGLEEYGDDFALVAVEYDHSEDDLDWIDESTVDDSLAEVYEAATEAIDIIPPADVDAVVDAALEDGPVAPDAADAPERPRAD